MAKASMSEVVVGGIKVCLFGAERIASLPDKQLSVVFVLHGRQGTVKKVFGLCEALCEKESIVAVAFDQRNHGTRLLEEAQNGGWENPNHVLDMYSIQYGTSLDVSFLIDMLPAALGFEPASFGIVGVSLGGHVTLISMGLDPRLQFGVSIIGCADFRTLMSHRAVNNTKGEIDPEKDSTLGGRLNKQLQALLSRVDPISRCSQFYDRPLLFLSGADDQLVPHECSQGFFERVEGGSTQKGCLERKVYPKVGHQLVSQMVKDTAAWCWRQVEPSAHL